MAMYAHKRLTFARRFLGQLRGLNKKAVGKNAVDFEAFWTVTVEQTAAAYFQLQTEVGREELNPEIDKLTQSDQRFLASMLGVRGAGTHVKNVEFTTQKKKVRPELVLGMSVASLGLPPELIACTEGSWGAYVVVQEFLHGTNKYEPTDAIAKCEQFLNIVADLVAKFE